MIAGEAPPRSVGLFAALAKPGVRPLALELISLAEASGVEVRMSPERADAIERPDLAAAAASIAEADLVVALSGTGGVLGAARASAPVGTPVLAVNLGQSGLLSSLPPHEFASAFARLLQSGFASGFEVEERMMLDARVIRRQPVVDFPSASPEIDGDIGLNEAVVASSAMSRMLSLSIQIDGKFVTSTRADGLIVATPTGSTAYALAAGGPVVHPGVPLLVICPICAHSLQQRPVIVGHNSVVDIRTEWPGDEVPSAQLATTLSIDGQVAVPLRSGDTVRVRCSSLVTRLLRKPGESFYERLRRHTSWGL